VKAWIKRFERNQRADEKSRTNDKNECKRHFESHQRAP